MQSTNASRPQSLLDTQCLPFNMVVGVQVLLLQNQRIENMENHKRVLVEKVLG